MKEKTKRVYKLSAVLMILCLVTACVIGTTLAKYTTSGSGSGTAQVAKWGVKVQITGADTTFNKEYKNGDNVTVTSNTNKLVAPGTSNENALTFSISGSPETSAKVEFEFIVNNDVFLAAEEHTDPIETKSVNIATEYRPIKFTLKKQNGENWDTVTDAENVSLSTIATVINGLCKTTTTETSLATPIVYAANTNLAETIGTYQLSWAWAFESENDAADTLLGNYIASSTQNSEGHWSTSIDYELKITVTQVD